MKRYLLVINLFFFTVVSFAQTDRFYHNYIELGDGLNYGLFRKRNAKNIADALQKEGELLSRIDLRYYLFKHDRWGVFGEFSISFNTFDAESFVERFYSDYYLKNSVASSTGIKLVGLAVGPTYQYRMNNWIIRTRLGVGMCNNRIVDKFNAELKEKGGNKYYLLSIRENTTCPYLLLGFSASYKLSSYIHVFVDTEYQFIAKRIRTTVKNENMYDQTVEKQKIYSSYPQYLGLMIGLSFPFNYN